MHAPIFGGTEWAPDEDLMRTQYPPIEGVGFGLALHMGWTVKAAGGGLILAVGGFALAF